MSPDWLRSFNPSYFSLTMATGIVAIALQMHGYAQIAQPFVLLALLSWVVLFILYTWRLIRFPKAVLDNLRTPSTAFSFFTFVAATNVCGLLAYDLFGPTVAVIAWVISFLYWSALMYFSFASLCFSHPARTPSIVDGGWLILIVGTQSLVLLGAQIAPDLGTFHHAMMVEITMLWCLGMVFYVIFVTLFCYRIFFVKTEASDFSPLIWVVMGAAAISANAGSTLLLADPSMPVLSELRPVILFIAILWWTWASWWIPMLVSIGLWKHGYCNEPIRYTPALWSMVFPLGMYAVATKKLVLSAQFTPLLYLSSSMLWVAVVVWILVAIGLIRHLHKHRKLRTEC